MNSRFITLPTESALLALSAEIAAVCQAPCIIFLAGRLGAGKTTFARGFLHGRGHVGAVKSPTYTLVEPYLLAQQQKIYHFDFYRLTDPQELEYIGIEEYFNQSAICLIEWPECALGMLPAPDLTCQIDIPVSGRELTMTAHSAQGEHILQRLTYAK